MLQTIDEVVAHIRQNVPQSSTITQLKPDTKSSYVTFHWNGRDFLVKKDMEVFELKNKQLFATGASILMQVALGTQNRNQKVLESTVDAVRQAEDLFGSGKIEQGLTLIRSIRVTLQRLTKRK